MNNAQLNAAADRYAAADRSDPFTRQRIATHIRIGLANSGTSYDATEKRTPGGLTIYREMKRP